MKLQYMGTAAAEAVPAFFCDCDFCEEARRRGDAELRLRSGACINDRVLIDFPPDIYESCRRNGVRLQEVTDIVFTHNHGDHLAVGELCWRYEPCYCLRRDHTPLRLWGTDAIRRRIDGFVAADEVWQGCTFHEIRYYEPFEVSGVTFTALPAEHMAPPPAAGQKAVPRSPDFPCIYLLEQDGKRFLYAHDTGVLFDEVYDWLKNVRLDAVSLDCCFGPNSCRYGHMGLPENAEVRARLLEQGTCGANTRFIANHFSHNGLHKDGVLYTREVLYAACAEKGFVPSRDGMTVEL